MATLFDHIPHLIDEVEKLIEHYREYEKGGWTHQSVTDMIGRFVASVTRLVYCPACFEAKDRIVGAVGAAGDHGECIEKSTVLAAFDRLYDRYLAPLNIPFIPDLVEEVYADPAVRKLLRDQVANTFDLVATLLRTTVPLPPVFGAAEVPTLTIVSDGAFGQVVAY